MRELAELLDRSNPAWPEIEGWVSASSNSVEVLGREPARAEQLLVALQVTTRSTLGAVAYETGGMLIDGGWVRVLGAGSTHMGGSLATWNGLLGARALADTTGMLLVAHDVLGG